MLQYALEKCINHKWCAPNPNTVRAGRQWVALPSIFIAAGHEQPIKVKSLLEMHYAIKIYTKLIRKSDFLYSISICWCCCCLFYPFSWPAHAASTWSSSSSSYTSLSSLKRCTLKAKAMSLLSEWVVYRFACLLVFFPQRRAVCTVACGMWRVPCVCPSLSQSASVCAFPCCHCIVAWNKLMFFSSLSLYRFGFFCDFCRNATETLLVCLCACACAFKSQSQNHNSEQ